MITLNLGDPTTQTVGTWVYQNIPQATVRLAVWNDSPCSLLIQFPDRVQPVASGLARLFEIEAGTQQLQWQVEEAIQASTSPYSKLRWECYRLQDPIPETYPIQIIRQQAVTGALSVSTVVAGVRSVNITDINQHTLLTYSVPAGVTSPIFRVNATLILALGQTSGTYTPNLTATYTDPQGGSLAVPLVAEVGAAGTTQQINGVNSFSSTGGQTTNVQIIPLVIHVAAGSLITLKYSDAGGTINDFLSAALEQIF